MSAVGLPIIDCADGGSVCQLLDSLLTDCADGVCQLLGLPITDCADSGSVCRLLDSLLTDCDDGVCQLLHSLLQIVLMVGVFVSF